MKPCRGFCGIVMGILWTLVCCTTRRRIPQSSSTAVVVVVAAASSAAFQNGLDRHRRRHHHHHPSSSRRQRRRSFLSTSTTSAGRRPGSIRLYGSGEAENNNSRDSGRKKEDDDDDEELSEYRNRNNIRDQVFSAISGDGGIKVTAATVRNIVNDMMIQHTMTEIPADALGRTIACSLLMANGIQDEQIVQITMNGSGPIRGVVAIAGGTGNVRGYVGSPMLGGGISLEDAVGRTGSVQIVKNHPDWPRPYNGITSIRHGDIDRDVGIYLAESEQRSCALAAATSVTGILCKAAGGYLIEQLPGVEGDTKRRVERNLARLVEMDGGDKLPTNLLLNGVTPVDIAGVVLDGLDMRPLQQIEPKLVCECSEERLFRSLRLLPRDEVEDILEKEERIEARCHFCGKVYRMGADEVREKLAAASSSGGDPSQG